MKKVVISVLLVVLFIVSAGVAGAEEKSAGDKKPRPVKVQEPGKMIDRGERSGRQRGRRNRRDRSVRLKEQLQKIDENIKTQQSEQKKFIAELVSIKDLAIKEKAKKTTKRIEALIKTKSAEFAASAQKLDESRERYRGMLVPPGSTLAERPKPAKAVATETKQEEKEEAKEDEGRWWQFWK